MSVIKVDVDALADMGKQFTTIKDDFDHIADVTKDADQYVGNPAIAKALEQFTSNWTDKRQQISALLATTATSVTKAAQAYHQSDQDAANQTGGHHQNSAGGSHHSGDHDAGTHPDGCTCGCGGTDTAARTYADTAGSGGDIPAGDTSAGDISASDTAMDDTTPPPVADSYTPADTGDYSGGSADMVPADTGSLDTGSEDTTQQDAAPISGQGSVSDSGDVGMSAQASGDGGSAGASSGDGGGPGGASMAAMAAPIGLLGAAGAAAWAAQKRRDTEQGTDDEFDE